MNVNLCRKTLQKLFDPCQVRTEYCEIKLTAFLEDVHQPGGQLAELTCMHHLMNTLLLSPKQRISKQWQMPDLHLHP